MNIKPIMGGCLLALAMLLFLSITHSEPVTTTEALATETSTQEEPTPEPKQPAETKEPTKLDAAEVELIARTIWGEAGGVQSIEERAAVAWCILNRVDAYGQTIVEVVTAPNQFEGYRTWGECPDEHMKLAADVLRRWHKEKAGAEDVGRTLPAEYLYFIGDGKRNHFSIEYRSDDFWTWSLESPYIITAETDGK